MARKSAHGDSVTVPDLSPSASRPYRSHKIPACDFCHRRKSRCVRLRNDQPCTLCRTYKIQCTTNLLGREIGRRSDMGRKSRRDFGDAVSEIAQTQTPNSRSRRLPKTSHQSTPRADVHDDQALAAAATTSPGTRGPPISNQARHIVGPVLARDAHVLEKYISPAYNTAVSHVRPNPYSVYSDDPRNPVVYMKVPRQRGVAPSGNGTSGFKQCETIEKILDPLSPDLFNL